MSFKSKDLMFGVLPAESLAVPGFLMCVDITRGNEPAPAPCADATQPPPEPGPTEEMELDLALLRRELRQALSEQAAGV